MAGQRKIRAVFRESRSTENRGAAFFGGRGGRPGRYVSSRTGRLRPGVSVGSIEPGKDRFGVGVMQVLEDGQGPLPRVAGSNPAAESLLGIAEAH